jgi:4-hydroxybenzoate polyprenyltransferase
VTTDAYVPDTQTRGLLALLPERARGYALLARFDRPIGAWLLFWPGAWAVLLAGISWPRALGLIVLLGIGSVAMRSAGCVYNDIVDRDLDARVERTRSRPLASGRIGLRSAWAFLIALCLVGLAVLVGLDWPARWISVAALAPVACYPFMKRITWWPQAWLGIVFSWAALTGWAAAAGALSAPGLLLYAGGIFWVIGYDTIYALQDIEDDVLAGVKSSARAMGAHVKLGVALCYAAALLLWCGAFWMRRPDPLALLALLPIGLHLRWQVATLRPEDAAGALARFRSNRNAGALLALAALVVGASS